MRAHIVLPDELMENVDSLVGKRKRSRFIEQAVTEKLRKEALLEALNHTAGALSSEEHPEWETREKVANWVRESRQEKEGLRRLESG